MLVGCRHAEVRQMGILAFQDHQPAIDPSVFLADGVYIIGQVEIGKDCSIWFNAVLRGDINTIRIGDRTNIQDGSIMHVTHEHPVRVGSDVTIGHRAIVHGATIDNCCLIGMGATILDNARVGSYSLVAAGAVVGESFVVPEGMLVAGVPAKIIRPLTQSEKDRLFQSAQGYVEYAKQFRTSTAPVRAL